MYFHRFLIFTFGSSSISAVLIPISSLALAVGIEKYPAAVFTYFEFIQPIKIVETSTSVRILFRGGIKSMHFGSFFYQVAALLV